MKEDLIRKFVEKLDFSYNYKTVNERQNIIKDLCEIAGIEQLELCNVVGQSEQLKAFILDYINEFEQEGTTGWERYNKAKELFKNV